MGVISTLSYVWSDGPVLLDLLGKAIGVAVVVYITYLTHLVVYNLYFHPLARFPGPVAFAASPIPFVVAQIAGKLPFIYQRLHETYGDVVRILPNELSINHVGAWQGIYNTYKGKTRLPKDPEAVVPSSNGIFNILSTPDVAEHARFRRVLNPIFSDRAFREQEKLVAKHVDLLVRQLRAKWSEGPQDMVTWFNLLVFDVISDLVLGDSLGQLRTGELHPWVRGLSGSTMQFTALQRAFRQFPHIKFILNAFTPKALIEQRIKHHAFVTARFEKRMTDPKNRYDFMSHVLPYDPKRVDMSLGEMQENFGALMIAGSENVATTLDFTLFYLLAYPKVYSKLVRDIREKFREDSEITFSSSAQLPYLSMVVDEAMRIRPAAPASQPRVVPAEGLQIAGHDIPGGVRVSVPPFCIHHDARYFSDPDSFNPERWLDESRGSLSNRSAFQPFGVGPRSCAGRSLAIAEVKMTLCKLLHVFDMTLQPNQEEWPESLKIYHLWDLTPYHVQLHPVRAEIGVPRLATTDVSPK